MNFNYAGRGDEWRIKRPRGNGAARRRKQSDLNWITDISDVFAGISQNVHSMSVYVRVFSSTICHDHSPEAAVPNGQIQLQISLVRRAWQHKVKLQY